MDYNKYVNLFCWEVHTIFCIVDYMPDNAQQEDLYNEFKRLKVDKKVIFYIITEGSIHCPKAYFKAVKEVCKVASSLQSSKDDMQPIAIFKGNIRFMHCHIPKLVRVSTALNIYHRAWDIFNLSVEDAIYTKEVLKDDVFRGNSASDKALLISPKIFQQLARVDGEHKKFNTMKDYIDAECKHQLLLAHPLCYQSDLYNLTDILVKADISLTVWYIVGKYSPPYVQRYFYNRVKWTHGIQ